MGLFGGILDSIGGFLGHKAQKKQAKKSVQDYIGARDQSMTAATGARDAAVGYFQPYATGGQQAFGNALNMQTPGFKYSPTDPSYGFRLREGENALLRHAAATGGAQSGGTLKALTRYGQDYASTEFQNDFDRNARLGNAGLQAAGGMAGAQSGYADDVSRAQFGAAEGMYRARTDKGNALAAQYGDAANGLSAAGKFFGF